MLRLLRVRHLIESSGDERSDLARLARSANYSPWNLIRVHRDVFGETPSEYAARLRLQHAWSLVRDTKTSICEISERSEEHTSELQSLMRISYAVFCLKKKNTDNITRLKTYLPHN